MVITDVNQVVYQGDGSTTAFPYTFTISEETVPIPIFGSADLKLLLINSDGTEQAITSDYYVDILNKTVHYPGYAPGSEPPLANQPPKVQTGQKLVIYRELPVTQERDLGDKWPFNPIEKALDKLTMLIQDWRDVLSRCLKVSVGSKVGAGSSFDPTVPLEAGKTFRVKGDGTGFESCETPSVAQEKAEEAQAAAEAARDDVEENLATLHEQLNAFLNEHSDGVMQFDGNFDIMPCQFPIGNDLWDVNPDGSLTPVLNA